MAPSRGSLYAIVMSGLIGCTVAMAPSTGLTSTRLRLFSGALAVAMAYPGAHSTIADVRWNAGSRPMAPSTGAHFTVQVVWGLIPWFVAMHSIYRGSLTLKVSHIGRHGRNGPIYRGSLLRSRLCVCGFALESQWPHYRGSLHQTVSCLKSESHTVAMAPPTGAHFTVQPTFCSSATRHDSRNGPIYSSPRIGSVYVRQIGRKSFLTKTHASGCQ